MHSCILFFQVKKIYSQPLGAWIPLFNIMIKINMKLPLISLIDIIKVYVLTSMIFLIMQLIWHFKNMFVFQSKYMIFKSTAYVRFLWNNMQISTSFFYRKKVSVDLRLKVKEGEGGSIQHTLVVLSTLATLYP